MIDIDTLFITLKEATKNVLKTLANMEAVAGEVVQPDKNTVMGYVSGNVGLTGEMKISVTVSFTKELITRIYANVFPEDASQVTIFHMGDFVGEVTNMISGSLRSVLAGLEMRFESAIPTVVIGSQQIYHPSGTIAKIIPFEVSGEKMFVEVGIKAL
jgi:chemotaxis protein CheX